MLALHEEDPSLSGAGVMHEGEVPVRLGLAGIPSISESTMIARDAAIAGYEGGRIHIQHLSALESVEAWRWPRRAAWRSPPRPPAPPRKLTHEALLRGTTGGGGRGTSELDTRLR